MDSALFDKTTIGADFNKTPQNYPVNFLLDYLHGLMVMRDANKDNFVWEAKYCNEIEATKEILKEVTKMQRL